MTPPPVRRADGRLAWRCDACGRVSAWTDDHMVYGRLRDEDEGRWERLTVTCSTGCRVGIPPVLPPLQVRP